MSSYVIFLFNWGGGLVVLDFYTEYFVPEAKSFLSRQYLNYPVA